MNKYPVLVVLFTLMIWSAITSQPANNDTILQADFPTLCRRAGAQQSADYVIVIDKSGSMQRFWSPVKQALLSFVEAIPDGDYLSLVVFGTTGEYVTTPTPINPATRQIVRQAINGMREPSDSNTDLGLALEKCLDELNRPGGNTLKFVFFLTDFNHDPPRGSPYARSSAPQEEVWQRLARRRQNEQTGKIYDVTALLLPVEAQVGRNLNLGRAIFPQLHEERVNQQTLGSWFERRRAEIARDKLRIRVVDDLQKSPLVIEKVEMQLPLFRSQGQLVAWVRATDGQMVDVTRVHSVQSTIEFKGGLAPEMEIEPVKGLTLSFESGQSLQPLILATVKCARNPLLRSNISTQVQLDLNGTEELSPVDELRKLNLPSSAPLHVAAVLGVELKYGYVPVIVLVGLFALIAVAVTGRLYYCRPEYIVGNITVQGVRNRDIRPGEKKTEILIGNISSGEGIQVAHASWRVSVRAFKPCRKDGKPRGVYSRVDNGKATLLHGGNREPLAADWKKLPRGSTIEIGGSRIIWT